MRKITMMATLLFAIVSFAAGQEVPFRPAVSTTVPSTTRHEIVQAPLPNSFITLRLDKFTGRVFYLTTCPQRNVIGSGLCWKETTVLELPKPATDGAVRYQLFAQGETNRHVLLFNNVTGQTWQLGLEDGLYKWTPFLDAVNLPQSFEIVR
jgi:hypothetical protein